ncbi:MAG: thiamine-monophosphate kinase [Desulfovibrionaceae bacterium]|nr:thiamine-monophosphate kinase [Desulfovibrionaceae bacterium]
MRSENDFLSLLDSYFNLTTPHQLSLRGDDCAELLMPEEVCLSSDLFLEDIHFRTSYFSYYELGYKALAVNLSDLAAAGARPLGFNMNLILPASMPRSDVEQLLEGMSALASRYNLPLTGGDLSRGDKLGLCISIWGEMGGARFLRRGQCRPGDTLFIVADSLPFPLGLARAGLYSLEKWGREGALVRQPQACKRHLLPNPLIEAGLSIARLAPQTSLMDLSDGLARDLPRLLGYEYEHAPRYPDAAPVSAFGARIDLPEALLHPELLAWCRQYEEIGEPRLNPVAQAMLGGEDYLLLGSTDSPEVLPLIEADCGVYCQVIGKVEKNCGIVVNDRAFSQNGFDHFNC